MSGTWASGWALNDIVTVAEFAKGVGCVADSTLGAGAASIDFTGLPTTYAHLMVFVYGRGDTAALNTAVLLRFNNDSAGNYDYQRGYANGATAGAAETFAATSVNVGQISAATAPANVAGGVRIDVPSYAGTTFQKSLTSQSSYKTSTAASGLIADYWAGFWRSTAAVNRITLFPAAGNFIAGTRASVYVWGA